MADNKIEPCQFCGEGCEMDIYLAADGDGNDFRVNCSAIDACGYQGPVKSSRESAIAAHNRVSCNNAIVDELGKALEGFVTDYDEGFPAGDNMQANLPTARAAIAKWKGEQDV